MCRRAFEKLVEKALERLPGEFRQALDNLAIVIEDNDCTQVYRQKYRCVTAIQPDTEWQRQANNQYLESFKSYSPELAFPRIRGGG